MRSAASAVVVADPSGLTCEKFGGGSNGVCSTGSSDRFCSVGASDIAMIAADVTSAGSLLRPLRWLTYAGVPSIPLAVWQSTRPEWMTAAVVAAVVVVLVLDAVPRRI